MKQLLVLFLITSTFCFSQQEKFEQLDSLFELLSSNNKMMGSLSILKDGKSVYNNSIGYQYITKNDKKKATKESKYRIGSITKMFTAVLVFQLLDEGKIALDDNLSKYYPELPNASKITISNLLTHSSGLYNITNESDFSSYMLEPTSQDQMLTRIKKHEVDFQPGEKNEYSNTNFILLGYILEKIENKTYKAILKSRIVNKLNLKNTYVGSTINTNELECQSYNYQNNNLNQATETHMSNPVGAGAIVSNPSDLVVFIDALFNNKLISNSSFKEMTRISNDYGSGILKLERNGITIFGHNGRIDSFESFIIYAPELKTAVAINTNASVYGLIPVMFNALDASNGKSFALPNFNKIQLTEQEAKIYEGVYESSELPYDLTFKAKGEILKAGPDLQNLSVLTATKKDEFLLESLGVTIKFNNKNNTLLFVNPLKEPVLFTKKH